MGAYIDDRLASLEAYVPGEQPRDREYIKLNANESPFPPSPGVLRAVSAAAGGLNMYPDAGLPGAEGGDSRALWSAERERHGGGRLGQHTQPLLHGILRSRRGVSCGELWILQRLFRAVRPGRPRDTHGPGADGRAGEVAEPRPSGGHSEPERADGHRAAGPGHRAHRRGEP